MGTVEGFDARAIISQETFVSRANQLEDPTLSAEKAGELGEQVLKILSSVKAGSIEIDPPLKEEQTKKYEALAAAGIVMNETIELASTGRGIRSKMSGIAGKR